uniref:Uncharacterized protein n=1 Tax=Lepeophtheirus salmonis TaxID=72036 RepID=A0A0K2VHL8_LEPSM
MINLLSEFPAFFPYCLCYNLHQNLGSNIIFPQNIITFLIFKRIE